MIDVYKLCRYVIHDHPDRIDAECDSCSVEIINKLGYNFDIYYILEERFKEPVYIYSFLEGCEEYKITFDEVLDYLNMSYGSEWDCVKKLDIQSSQKFEDFSLNLREYHKANELMKWVKKGEFDYYEKAAYKSLEPETQEFVVFLAKMEIATAIRYANKLCRIINRHLVEYNKERKRSAVNCWKFLEMIK